MMGRVLSGVLSWEECYQGVKLERVLSCEGCHHQCYAWKGAIGVAKLERVVSGVVSWK